MEGDAQLAILQAENELLRQDNAALQEALRVAQLGGVDLQGHLSKFNPDAAEQGIFTQEWELRFFRLSGTLLKYWTSDRDVGRQYRGVLALEGCMVEVEAPASAKGPFAFDINDPDGETLLRLSADKLTTAKTWVKTLHAVGLPVRGFRRLTAVGAPGWRPNNQQQQQQSVGRSFASIGRAISGRWSTLSQPADVAPGNSLGSEVSMRFQPPRSPQQGLRLHASDTQAAADAAVAAAAAQAEDDVAPHLQQQPSVGPPAPSLQRQRQQQQQQQQLGGDSTEDDVADDGVILDDSDDEADLNRLSRLRRKCRAFKGKLLHGRTMMQHGGSHASDSMTSTAAAPGGPIAAAGGGGGSSSSGMAAAAAAAAATPFVQSVPGSSRHRRTASAPLQKQVSWRFVDRGDDERPEFDHSDDLDNDDSSSSFHSDTDEESDTATSAAHKRPAAAAGLVSHPDLLQQQQQLEEAAAAAGVLPGDLPAAAHHLEGIQELDEEQSQQTTRPKRISAFGAATEAAAIAAAGGISDANPDAAAAAAVHGPPTPPAMPSAAGAAAAALAGAGRSGFKGGSGMGSLKGQATGVVVKPKRGPMVGYSAVHVAAKDSILTEHDRYGVMRHEGFLNLGVVVLLATNLRMIINNLLTYGLRMRVNRAVLGSVLPLPLSRDDVVTLLAIPLSCLAFPLAALLLERLGLMLLRRQEQMLQGLQKKDSLTPAQMTAQGSACSSRQEGLLLLANLLNAGGSLVVPCCLVLSNKAGLVPGFLLTVVAIVMSMKLATYAHCNAALRCEARRRAVEAAAAGRPVAPLPLQLQSTSGSGGSSRRASQLWRNSRTRLLAASGLATAATHTAAAGGRSGSGSSSAAPPALRGSATDPSAFFLSAGLSRTGSLSRRAAAAAVAAGLTVGEVLYPNNLNVRELAYFMAAPTLTYQLNFPRLRQRRWRLLSRWLLLAALTAIAMSFMQVQFLLPCMQSSLLPLREMHMGRFLEQLLRLSMPNTAVWLAMFYLVFHLWLNILGELLLFGDRQFYKEWWNAATLADYWKLWNIPVHKWMLRTIFFPLVRRGAPRLASLLFVFLISALMHEIAVGVPLRMLRGWAFWGMMLQVPLITATELLRKRLKADTLGNMLFWCSFCIVGQPMCLVLYYRDWLLANLGEHGWRAAAAQGSNDLAALALNGTLSTVAGSLVY